MTINGYTATLNKELLKNPALICVGAFGAAAVWGVTRGGSTFDEQAELSEVDFDGKLAEVKGLNSVSKTAPKLAFTVIQLGTVAQIQRLFPGSSTATSTVAGISTIITPRDSGKLFAAGNYIDDVWAIWEKGEDGKYVAIHIFSARVKTPALNGGAAGQVEIPVEIYGVADLATRAMEDPLFEILDLTALPTA